MKKRTSRTVAALASAFVLVPAANAAEPKTSDMNVSLTVEASCELSTSPLAFSGYDGSANSDATATIDVTCTNGTPYRVSLEGSSAGVRQMANGQATLSYSLFSDAGRTALFTENTSGDLTTANGSKQSLTVYGRVPGSQQVTVGSYADTVTVTLTY